MNITLKSPSNIDFDYRTIASILQCMSSGNPKCACSKRNASVFCNPKKGIYPRAIGGNPNSPKVMVIALNPGPGLFLERLIYKCAPKLIPKLTTFVCNCNLTNYLFGSKDSGYWKNLNRLLFDQGARLKLKEVYHTNLVKCQSRTTGKVSKDDMMACFNKFLSKELELVKAKKYLLLGKKVLQFFKNNACILPQNFPKEAVEALNDEVYFNESVAWYYHPSRFKGYQLNNPDFEKIVQWLQA